jgi:class 3 adenylate cyclase
VPGAEGVTAHARRALLTRGFAPPLVERLVELLHRAPDRELLRLRPFALARALGEEPVTVLRLMLHAAREGLLEMTWDLVCPQCRGAKQRPSDLGRVVSEVHCGSCNIKFDADFDRSVEVTFRPAPGVRSIPDAEYCVGGPGNTRHVVAQRRVPARSRVEMDLALAPGSYRLRGPRTAGVLSLAIAAPGAPAGAAEPLAVALDRHGIAPDQATRASGILRVAVDNTDDREQLAILEHTAWSEDVASAAFVTTLQEFRDLFSSQVVSPGTRIGIRSIAFLFTDLKSSTAMYEKVGDASAFALVRDHFHILFNSVSTEQGGVVKTIGDAVMASFANPANALRAAFHMQDLMAEFNERTRPPYPIQLKIGVHAGPCIAVNLNDRLDYFGTTVNMAARIQNESVGDDIVVLATLLEHPSVEALLGELRYRAEPFETELKGLTGTFHLVRLLPERPSPLPAT